MKKVGAITVLLLLVAATAVIAWTSMQTARSTPTPTVVLTTKNGAIACLPSKGGGLHTTECALGIVDQEGRYYGLKNLPQADAALPGGTKVRVEGRLQNPPADERYDIGGIIDVTKVTKTE